MKSRIAILTIWTIFFLILFNLLEAKTALAIGAEVVEHLLRGLCVRQLHADRWLTRSVFHRQLSQGGERDKRDNDIDE